MMKDMDAELADLPLLLKISPDVTSLTSLGRSTIYAEVASGRLRAVKIGRSIRIRRDDLLSWLDAHTANPDASGDGGTAASAVPEGR